MSISKSQVKSLNKDIELFLSENPEVSLFKVDESMNTVKSGVSRLVFMDRYAFKDLEKKTLKIGDIVLLTVKEDPQFPARGIGKVLNIIGKSVHIQVDEEYRGPIDDEKSRVDGIVIRGISEIDKPLELFYEQVAKRVAKGLSDVEEVGFDRESAFNKFYRELRKMNVVPAGRVLHGAGTNTNVTYFNCYVMPFPRDSRTGIGEHRNTVMEIMSRGGGVGTNGSTLRPKNSLAKGVNGKSSGAVSWMEDIAKLTNLVQQGGSRRGAQMGMMIDSHPDILEFIISKMQNPKILRFLIENSKDEQIKQLAQDKLKFESFSIMERRVLDMSYEKLMSKEDEWGLDEKEEELKVYLQEQIDNGGHYSVHNPEFLTGMNISVCITKEFMEALENDEDYALRFPDIDNYTPEQKAFYDEYWHECGDVREWEEKGLPVKTYRTIKAKELWDLINICATYSAEPGIFFIDNANEMTNATSYGQKVVATNPCGEQPLSPFAVCNLLAINLANMFDHELEQIDYLKLKNSVSVAVRMADNVIDATPYFLDENKKQALGERRIGLGVMGLADLLVHCGVRYGSEEGNKIVDKVFETIAVTAYNTSIDISYYKGPFGFMLNKEGKIDRKVAEKFVNTGFMRKMPNQIREDILTHGIRNSHLLTVAPTGSTGTLVGVATGLEPYFAFKYYRSGRLGKFIEVEADIVKEFLNENPQYTFETLPEQFVTAMELAPEDHADVQCIIQRWIDSSISKTVNAPAGYSVEEVQAVYERLYAGGAKGGTVYVDGSRNAQVLSLKKDEAPKQSKPKKSKVIVTETIKPLEQTSVKIGTEIGDTCPMCREGKVIDSGGCSTCDSCGSQLKCGL